MSPSAFGLPWLGLCETPGLQSESEHDVLRALITAAVVDITNDMLQSVWQGMDCR